MNLSRRTVVNLSIIMLIIPVSIISVYQCTMQELRSDSERSYACIDEIRLTQICRIKGKSVIAEIPMQMNIYQENNSIERGGKFFITGDEIIYVKNGNIAWQSSPVKKYIKAGGKFYIATGDSVFCTLKDATVVWKTPVANAGSCHMERGILVVQTSGGHEKLNPATGEIIH